MVQTKIIDMWLCDTELDKITYFTMEFIITSGTKSIHICTGNLYSGNIPAIVICYDGS